MLKSLVAGATLGIATTVMAVAQTPPKPATPPVEAEPLTTSATYGDWVLRCQRRGEGAGAVKQCEVDLTVQVQQQQAPVAQIALGHPAKGDPMHLTAQLPVSVSFPSSVKLFGDDKDIHPLELAWKRCAPIGCFADTTLTDDQIKILRARTDAGQLEFLEADGRPVRLPISFRGLAQALDALSKAN